MITGSARTAREFVPGAALLLVIGLVSCERAHVVEGECRDVHGADVCAWGVLARDSLVEFGVTFPLVSAENAPTEGGMTWPPAPIAVLDLPDEVEAATGFGHFELNWERHGHPPEIFMTPHFDFHFYHITPEQVNAIDCANKTKPEQLPVGYVLPDIEMPEIGELVGLCAPAMGMHAMREDEYKSAEPFSSTLVIGYYGGELTFIEPMAARTTLLEEKSFSLDIPPLPGYAEGLRYPMRFEAEYDASAREYRLVFSEFTGP